MGTTLHVVLICLCVSLNFYPSHHNDSFFNPPYRAAFNLDFYTEVMDLTYLLDHLAADPFFKKFHLLNTKLAEVIQDYSLVSFVPLNVQVLQTCCRVPVLTSYSCSKFFYAIGIITAIMFFTTDHVVH